MNPYESDESPLDDESSPCACHDPSCRIDGNDATNVLVNGQWFSCDCVGLCYFCGEVDSLHRLIEISGSWLSHEGCVALSPQISDDLYRALHADEQRDDMNRTRR